MLVFGHLNCHSIPYFFKLVQGESELGWVTNSKHAHTDFYGDKHLGSQRKGHTEFQRWVASASFSTSIGILETHQPIFP